MPVVWPDDLQFKADIPPIFDAVDADQEKTIARIMRTGLVNSVEFVPDWSVTGAVTNNRTFTLFNRRSDGTGTTTMALLALTSGTNLTRGVAATITLQSAANRLVAVGDILQWESLHVGSGLPDPGGQVIVQQTYTP